MKSSCSETSKATDVYATRSNLIEKDDLRDTGRLSPAPFSAVPETGITTRPEQISSTLNVETLGSTISRCDAHSIP